MNSKPRSATLIKPHAVIGNRLRFRNAVPEDAAFILSLRLNPEKNRHLSTTDKNLAAQVEWLDRYASDSRQVYFIVEDNLGQSVGTVRLYDVRGDSFCWGSWILAEHAPKSSAVESTLLVYVFGLACGFSESHFEVRRGNERVWEYHERLGAERTSEDADNFHYRMSKNAIDQVISRYHVRIPNGVSISW